MDKLEAHMNKILTFLLAIEATGGRLQQRVYNQREQLMQEGELIKENCKRIKAEVKSMAMISEEFKRYVDEQFRIH